MADMYDFGAGLVPAHKHPNGGGWVADSAHVADTAYVGPNARVYGNAHVYDKARVFGRTRVYGNAQVYGEGQVYDKARVSGKTRVCGLARVFGDVWMWGNAPAPSDAEQSELAREILERVDAVDMSVWHSECGTAHCVAGWCQVLRPGVGNAYEAGVRYLPKMAPYFFGLKEDAVKKLAEIAEGKA